MNGPRVVTCLANGTWSVDVTTLECSPATCELPVLASLTYPPTLIPQSAVYDFRAPVLVSCTHLRSTPLQLGLRRCNYFADVGVYSIFHPVCPQNTCYITCYYAAMTSWQCLQTSYRMSPWNVLLSTVGIRTSTSLLARRLLLEVSAKRSSVQHSESSAPRCSLRFENYFSKLQWKSLFLKA